MAGVTLQMTGRSGELVYTDGSRRASAYVEISGALEFDLLVTNPDRWSDGSAISAEDRAAIARAFDKWAKKTRTRCQW
jgi:hypothetical protein